MFRASEQKSGTRSRCWAAAAVAVSSAGVLLLGVVPASAAPTGVKIVKYSGHYEEFAVPKGVDKITVTAVGGGGGAGMEKSLKGTVGAATTAVVNVQEGDSFKIGAGGLGQEWRKDGKTPKGGWGGLDASGGDAGRRSELASAAGGGASTVELNRDGHTTTIMIAGGGGGDGGTQYPGGISENVLGGVGGQGGARAEDRTAQGDNGGNAPIHGSFYGSGGQAGKAPSSAGQAGWVDEGLVPGGGGGGGVKGGECGQSSSRSGVYSGGGGGGGAGSSMIDESVNAPHIRPAISDFRATNGQVLLSW